MLWSPRASPERQFFFFFNDTATTEIYTLSLHDALPISSGSGLSRGLSTDSGALAIHGSSAGEAYVAIEDRKSTRRNSSHHIISHAVFCFKKKKNHSTLTRPHKLHTALPLPIHPPQSHHN